MQPNKHAEISAASWSQMFTVWIKTAMDTCQSGKFRILDFFFSGLVFVPLLMFIVMHQNTAVNSLYVKNDSSITTSKLH